MIIHFRTKRNINGHCKYLGIDTENKQFARESSHWISAEYPELKKSDYNALVEQLRREKWQEIERI